MGFSQNCLVGDTIDLCANDRYRGIGLNYILAGPLLDIYEPLL